MISDSRDNTSRLPGTISCHVDAAGVRRVVGGVDVVPLARVCEGRNVCDFVGEESCFANVLAIEEVVGEARGGGCEVEGREVGNCAVAKGAPCCGEGQKSEERGREKRNGVHGGRL